MQPSSSTPGATAGEIARAVASCRANKPFLASLREVYRDADAAVRSSAAVCRACGKCCRFDEAGHLLYVTPGELALLTALPPPAGAEIRAGRCAYQVGDICTARDRRALGCRLFFCEPDLPEIFGPQYEELHRRIRRLHTRAAVSYLYVELSGALAALEDGSRLGQA